MMISWPVGRKLVRNVVQFHQDEKIVKLRAQGEKMKFAKVEVEGIKLAVSKFYKTDALQCRKILLESIQWLRDRYERLKEEEDLKKALCHMEAYGELGFSYDDVKDEAEEIFGLLEADREVRKEFRRHFCEKIVVNKTRVNRLLGRWNPARHSMRISDAVDDIIRKVTEQEEGISLYHCGRKIAGDGEDGLWEHTFRLQIQDGEAIFHDVNNNQYYLLLKEETHAENCNCR